MKPIKFKGQNVTFAKNQPQYLPLPAHRTPQGEVITCWKLEDDELKKINKTGVVYLRQLTFNQPLQPVLLSTENLVDESKIL